ncbi:peptidase M23B [Psychromonas sp. CNPT3]|uniref:peptidoglycan DD-metalloendopeptidase family protein n=1 Tax=Psychromonas sp. CNPT3 TaxID=314282 RepID=UPI00006E7641|nr:peptidoglycan DD-metalloendopeptidase family protein [Psychromonas sp. CNPT3]AGH80303.1 peptidase M23B [Psychromonas sp. CNPT3]
MRIQIEAFFQFINNLPRKHFFALILLFVFLLVIAFLPSQQQKSKHIKRILTLSSEHGNSASVEPLSAIADEFGMRFANKEGDRKVDVEIVAGDTVSEIFQREGLSAALLQELLDVDQKYLRLGNLLPGQKLKMLMNAENKLLVLKVIIDRASTLTFTLKGDEYVSLLETKKGVWSHSLYKGIISGSFYINAKHAGLSAGQIQQISNALEEKINFNRQLRAGDSFKVLVAKNYIDGTYSFDSEVLAVLIKTRSKTYTAFLSEDGRYYDEDGLGLSKAYRRLPVNGHPRISSPFNLRRLHPITKRVSPHLGTDFAVVVGTRVYSIGDGIVLRAGYHPAAGNYIVIKNSRKYTTRFLHLSKILVRRGQRVEMGDLIAKSGNTGRSTGPHLHYEFHINGRAVNAMKVNLPLSKSVLRKDKKAFNKRRDGFLNEIKEA